MNRNSRSRGKTSKIIKMSKYENGEMVISNTI